MLFWFINFLGGIIMQVIAMLGHSYQAVEETASKSQKPFLKTACFLSVVVFAGSFFLGDYIYLAGAVSKIPMGNILRVYSAVSLTTALVGLYLSSQKSNPIEESVQDLQHLEEQLEEKEKMVQALKKHCEELQESLSLTEEDLRATQEAMSKTSEHYQNSLGDFRESNQTLTKGLAQFDDQLKKIQSLTKNVHKQGGEWDEDQVQLTQRIKEIDLLTKSLADYAKGFVQNVQEYKHCLQSYQAESMQIKEQNQTLAEQNQELSLQVRSLQESLGSLQESFRRGHEIASTIEEEQEAMVEKQEAILEERQKQMNTRKERWESLQETCQDLITISQSRKYSQQIRYLDRFFRKLEAWKSEGFPSPFEEKLDELMEFLRNQRSESPPALTR